MTRDKFDRLRKGRIVNRDVEMDGKTFRVTDTDAFGRVKLRQVTFFYDIRGEEFDTFDECQEALQDAIELCDEDDPEYEDLLEADVEEHATGNSFWMHYKDIEED